MAVDCNGISIHCAQTRSTNPTAALFAISVYTLNVNAKLFIWIEAQIVVCMEVFASIQLNVEKISNELIFSSSKKKRLIIITKMMIIIMRPIWNFNVRKLWNPNSLHRWIWAMWLQHRPFLFHPIICIVFLIVCLNDGTKCEEKRANQSHPFDIHLLNNKILD